MILSRIRKVLSRILLSHAGRSNILWLTLTYCCYKRYDFHEGTTFKKHRLTLIMCLKISIYAALYSAVKHTFLIKCSKRCIQKSRIFLHTVLDFLTILGIGGSQL